MPVKRVRQGGVDESRPSKPFYRKRQYLPSSPAPMSVWVHPYPPTLKSEPFDSPDQVMLTPPHHTAKPP